jgi:hypothetical protein
MELLEHLLEKHGGYIKNALNFDWSQLLNKCSYCNFKNIL